MSQVAVEWGDQPSLLMTIFYCYFVEEKVTLRHFSLLQIKYQKEAPEVLE